VTARTDVLPQPTSPEQHRFHFLDALRGIAAILVVWRHAPPAFAHALEFPNSYMAVDFFFCLSGFVIAFSYEQRLRTSLTAGRFAVMRLTRLYPLAVLGTLIGIAEAVLPNLHSTTLFTGKFIREIVLGLMMVPYLTPYHPLALTYVLDGVLWTLFVELVANFLYAAMVRLRIAGSRVIALLAAASFALLVHERHAWGTFDIGSTVDTTHVALTRVGFSFFAGVLVYRLYKHRAPKGLTGSSAGLAALLLTTVFVAWLCAPAALTQPAVAEFATICVLFPLTVYLGARLSLRTRWNRVCAFLGTISYPVYVLHVPFLWFLTLNTSMRLAVSHASITTPVMLAFTLFTVIASWLAAQFYDTPVRRMLTKKFRRPSSSRPALAAVGT